MLFRVGINDVEASHWVAWVFDLFGCFAKALTREAAVAGVPQAIKDYSRWLRSHNHPFLPEAEAMDVIIAEDITSHTTEDDYIVNAFFEDDRRPLSAEDIAEVRRLLAFARGDLSQVIEGMTRARMHQPIEHEVHSTIRGILNHIAVTEQWYFDRIDMSINREEFPQEVLQRLKTARKHTISVLPKLQGMAEVFEKSGEGWSARKVLRRTLWHELAHTRQIQNYLARIGESPQAGQT